MQIDIIHYPEVQTSIMDSKSLEQGCTRTPFTEHEQTFSPNGHTNKTSVQPNTNTNTNPTRTRTRTKHEHSFSIPTWGSRKLEPFLSNLVPNWASFGSLWGPESLSDGRDRRPPAGPYRRGPHFRHIWLPILSQFVKFGAQLRPI